MTIFQTSLNNLPCNKDTQAYIIGIYKKYLYANSDLSKDSIGLIFLQARLHQNFATYQTIGDWLFFTSTIAPKHLSHASKDYYDNLGRLSYYSCYKLIHKKWALFEELSDSYIILEEEVKNRLSLLQF